MTTDDTPMTPLERAVAGLAIAVGAAVIWCCCVMCAGCANPNTGVSAAAGDITTLPEISDASDNISIKVLYMMTGARVWTAKNAIVKMEYENAYTNRYFGVIETHDRQRMKVVVEPCETQPPTETGGQGEGPSAKGEEP